MVDVSPTVRGATAALTLLTASGLLERLPLGVSSVGDLAYVGMAVLSGGDAAGPTSSAAHRACVRRGRVSEPLPGAQAPVIDRTGEGARYPSSLLCTLTTA
jgi:hypothetical protein